MYEDQNLVNNYRTKKEFLERVRQLHEEADRVEQIIKIEEEKEVNRVIEAEKMFPNNKVDIGMLFCVLFGYIRAEEFVVKHGLQNRSSTQENSIDD